MHVFTCCFRNNLWIGAYLGWVCWACTGPWLLCCATEWINASPTAFSGCGVLKTHCLGVAPLTTCKHQSCLLYEPSRGFCPARERASTLRAHEQPCLFVLRDWKWRRTETKAITWVCKGKRAVIETQKPPTSDSRSYLRFAAADGTYVGHSEKGFLEQGLHLPSRLAS